MRSRTLEPSESLQNTLKKRQSVTQDKSLSELYEHPPSRLHGTMSTDEVVFEPKDLLHLLSNNSLTVEDQYHLTIQAEGQQAVIHLLQAALGDWVDFVFVPSPEVLAIYADHDEYTTFYTRDDATLKNVTSGLEKSGFEAVPDYTRRSSGNKWR